jgi:hypothetical protein
MKALTQRPDNNRNLVYAIAFNDHINTVVVGTTAKSVTVPTGAEIVVFNATGDFCVDAFKTAVLPTSDLNDGTGSEMNPATRDCKGLSSLSVIALTPGTNITLNFYS